MQRARIDGYRLLLSLSLFKKEKLKWSSLVISHFVRKQLKNELPLFAFFSRNAQSNDCAWLWKDYSFLCHFWLLSSSTEWKKPGFGCKLLILCLFLAFLVSRKCSLVAHFLLIICSLVSCYFLLTRFTLPFLAEQRFYQVFLTSCLLLLTFCSFSACISRSQQSLK